MIVCQSERSEESLSQKMYGYTKGKILRCAQDDKMAGLFIAYLCSSQARAVLAMAAAERP